MHRKALEDAQAFSDPSGESSGPQAGRRHWPSVLSLPEGLRAWFMNQDVSVTKWASATCCWAAADVYSLFTGAGPGGSLSTPTMSAPATPSPRPPVPTTASSRACPATRTACPSPTAACESPPLSASWAIPSGGFVFPETLCGPPAGAQTGCTARRIVPHAEFTVAASL